MIIDLIKMHTKVKCADVRSVIKSVLACFFLAGSYCSNVYGTEYHRVARVIDGDTVVLDKGRKVRMLGINTPEIGYRGKPNEAGALEAKYYLKELVLNKVVSIEHDVEREDKYSRMLGHIFLEDGRYLNAEMLRHGLAMLSLHPPNLKYSARLMRAQADAEKRQVGLWAMNAYQSKSVVLISANGIKKWGRFSGTVRRVSTSKKGMRIWLDETTYVWIGASHQHYFDGLNFDEGQPVEVRGWPRKWGKYWSIRAIHPSQIVKR